MKELRTHRLLGGRALATLSCALGAALAVSACAPTDHPVVLKSLRSQLVKQYHECVPIGWNPVPASGTYYPGVNVVPQEEEVWLPALWIARVRARVARRPDVRAVSEVLDALVRAGLIDKEGGRGGATYRLTERGLPYYFASNEYGNNPLALPYLCYSTIVPQRVVETEAIHTERLRGDSADSDVFRARVEWVPGPVAAWANDPVLQSHSVVLAPVSSPLVATFVREGRDWDVRQLSSDDAFLPRVVNASV